MSGNHAIAILRESSLDVVELMDRGEIRDVDAESLTPSYSGLETKARYQSIKAGDTSRLSDIPCKHNRSPMILPAP